MSLPHLLLVDDSDAILNFEKAVLSGLYRLSTASNGVEALEKIKELKPDGVLLDLSMPQMDGDEVLKIIKADPDFSSNPFLVISSEKSRAEACLKTGAEGLLDKPILADELKARVAFMLEAALERERKKSSAFLFISAGPFELGLPLKPVVSVHSQPATRPASAPSDFRREVVDYYGEDVGVLDLARVLGVEYAYPLEDRKLVFLRGKGKIALCVDSVFNPEELLPDQVHPVSKAGPGAAGRAKAGAAPDPSPENDGPVLSMAESSRGLIPILNPEALFTDSLFPQLAKHLSGQGEKSRDSREGPRAPRKGAKP
jgi:CheY-like chemotaxis protein/chemotaxis signal transduction protein